jgi:phage tail-like protein
MDSNQQRFWMLSDAADWLGLATERDRVEYDGSCRRLRLRDRRPARSLPGGLNETDSNSLLGRASRAIDAFGTVAVLNTELNAVQAVGGLGPGVDPITLWNVPAQHRVTDLATGFDDVLYLAVQEYNDAGGVVRSFVGLFDPRGRWRRPPVFELSLAGFTADKLAADPGGGVWVLDRGRRQVGRVRGLPLRDGLPPPFSPTTFRPSTENAEPTRFTVEVRQPALVDGEQPVALACSPDGRLAVLAWRPDFQTFLYLRDPAGAWGLPRRLIDPGEANPGFQPIHRSRPATLAWVSKERLVALPGPRIVNGQPAQAREAIPYDPDDPTAELQPAGGFYPVRGLREALFLKGVTLPPHYPVTGAPMHSRPLRALSVLAFARTGMAAGRPLDGGRAQTVWHRLYLEAILPPGCGIVVQLAATDEPDPDLEGLTWHPHLFGEVDEDGAERAAIPRGTWSKDSSEIPHHAGLLGRQPEPSRAGLFTVLAQRAGYRVRRLAGRYLYVRARLHGTGHRTPEIAALRAYASRFSYRDEYLAEVYHEELFGRDADRTGRATGPDFLERFLSLFESVLTPMEDRVAAAQVVMDPRSAPAEALAWLGSWIGVVFDESFPADRRRAWIESAPWLFRTHGTLAGLNLALEIATGGALKRGFVDRNELGSNGRNLPVNPDDSRATDLRESVYPEGGGVTGGEIVVLEDYRLRRTFATILGANLSEADDPVLPGLVVSANSRVGDTLFIGETEKTELLALFRDAFSRDPHQRARDVESVREFYSRLAHRATVFVHDSVESVDFGLLQRVALREAPAHVQVRVVRASYPLLIGLASLVGIDTYLGPNRQPRVAEVERSRIGEGDVVRGNPALDPRLSDGGQISAPPQARIDGPARAGSGESITLDGSRSTAAPGRVIERYIWLRRTLSS